MKIGLNNVVRRFAYTTYVITAFLTLPAQALDQATVAECNKPETRCFKPTPTEWSIHGPYWSNFNAVQQKAWCEARGGVYGGYATPTCEGGAPEDTLSMPDYWLRFLEIQYAPAQCTLVYESEWGYEEPSSNNGVITTKSFAGFLTKQFRAYQYQCIRGAEIIGSTFRMGRGRDLICPPYTQSKRTSADFICLASLQNELCPMVGNPITPLDGRKIQKEVDIDSPLATFVRTYLSDGFPIPGSIEIPADSSIGKFNSRWSHNFDYRLFFLRAGRDSFAVREPSGKINYFNAHGRESTGNPLASIELASDGEYIFRMDDHRVRFNNSGIALEIIRDNKNYQLHYGAADSALRLSSITINGMPTISFTYDVLDRIKSVTIDDDQTVEYDYDSLNGNLISADWSGGQKRFYLYENTAFPHALTGIINEKGIRFATWTYDDNGRAISSLHAGSAEAVSLDFSQVNNASDPRVSVTNALGKQTTYHYGVYQGIRKVEEIAGQASDNCAAANKAYTYYPNGTLQSKTDWSGNITTYVRDSFGRETSRTEASGTAAARTITTEYHPTLNLPVRITEPGKVTVMTYDASGRLLTQNIQSTTP